VNLVVKKLSTYIDYLPSILWSEESDPDQFLGQMLCIFEKILTGIENDKNDVVLKEEDLKYVSFARNNLVLKKGDREYASFEETIDELAQIFNPWKTPSETLPWLGGDPSKFLNWLASWVSLELNQDWNEYQKRKFISEIVSIYQQRGTKKGLLAYLNLYATEARPRIVIDEGEAIFRAKFLENGQAELYAVAHTQTVGNVTALLHPVAIAVDSKNNYIVADDASQEVEKPVLPAVWKVSSTGEIPYQTDTALPAPKPIHTGDPLKRPVAVTVDAFDRYSVLDIGSGTDNTPTSAIYRFDPSSYTLSTVISHSSTSPFPALYPVDMVQDRSGAFIVLDRGGRAVGDPPQGPTAPKIVVVRETNPLTIEEHGLTSTTPSIIEPTALVADAWGGFIIADAREPRNPSEFNRRADLIRVDPANGWSTKSLLSLIPEAENPLIFPTGLVFENSHSLLVCDTGVRWKLAGIGGSGYRALAELPAIYRVDFPRDAPIGQSSLNPTITKLTDDRALVTPTKMVFDRNGKLIISDRGGTTNLRSATGEATKREWRIRPYEIGVIVLFSSQRHTQTDERNRIRGNIFQLIEAQKPAHTSWSLNF
jgi:Phage tail protein (Tail_P2_I)